MKINKKRGINNIQFTNIYIVNIASEKKQLHVTVWYAVKVSFPSIPSNDFNPWIS